MRAKLGTMAVLIGLGLTTLGVAGVKAQEGPPPPGYYNQPWTRSPDQYRSDIGRRGFHDGIEGARRDFQNHRPPNVNNRDEYRHPNVGGQARHEYREAFRRGYQVGVQNIYNGTGGGTSCSLELPKRRPAFRGFSFGGRDRFVGTRRREAWSRLEQGSCIA